MRIVLLFLATLVVIAAGFAGYYVQTALNDPAPQMPATKSPPDHNSIVGRARPVFELPDTTGELRSVSEWDGRILVLNFWATWCTPCKEEIPEFVELQEKYRDAGVTFMGVALDQREPVRAFVERYDVNYPVLIGEQAAIAAAKDYGNHIGALPYTVFIDRDGRVAHVHRGRLPLEEAEALLRGLLPETAVEAG